MTIHIMGHKHKVVDFRHLKIWADSGLIKIEDSRDNSFEAISVKEALLRIGSLNSMRPGIDGTDDAQTRAWVHDERQAIQSFVEKMIEVVQQAREQGSPDDPTARNSLKAARPTTVVMPVECTLDF